VITVTKFGASKKDRFERRKFANILTYPCDISRQIFTIHGTSFHPPFEILICHIDASMLKISAMGTEFSNLVLRLPKLETIEKLDTHSN
jgi:hypothetical protein